MTSDRPEHVPPAPPISRRDQPRFRDEAHRQQLAAAFTDQGADYDRLRPGYPPAVIDALVEAAGAVAGAGMTTGTLPAFDSLPRATPETFAVDLGAGTGKLTSALLARGMHVTAVDPSRSMLEQCRDKHRARADTENACLRTVVAGAEATGLPAAQAHLVTAAQAWHWFDHETASSEAARLLVPGGVLALVWNMLDVTIPWVHRLSRIMHAGDVHREDFRPPVGPQFTLSRRMVHHWEDPMPTHDVIDLARTRSYVITATEQRRAKVLANLDWYLHEHLGHAPGSTIGVPYRTDLFLCGTGASL